jgi:hypothetical protein
MVFGKGKPALADPSAISTRRAGVILQLLFRIVELKVKMMSSPHTASHHHLLLNHVYSD